MYIIEIEDWEEEIDVYNEFKKLQLTKCSEEWESERHKKSCSN